MLSMFSRMAAAKNPDKILEMVFPACQIAMRIGFSSLVYHDEVTSFISTVVRRIVFEMRTRTY